VTKPAPVVSAGSGGAITTGDAGSGNAGNSGVAPNGLPAGGSMGGGGCSLSPANTSFGAGALLLTACIVVGSLIARLRQTARR